LVSMESIEAILHPEISFGSRRARVEGRRVYREDEWLSFLGRLPKSCLKNLYRFIYRFLPTAFQCYKNFEAVEMSLQLSQLRAVMDWVVTEEYDPEFDTSLEACTYRLENRVTPACLG